jgi:hypothetical protein
MILEGDLAAAGHFPESDADDVGPQVKRGSRKKLPAGSQASEVDAQSAAGTDVELSGGTADGLPVAVDELIGDLVIAVEGGGVYGSTVTLYVPV